MQQVNFRTSCWELFKKMGTIKLIDLDQFNSLMICIINNYGKFSSNWDVHSFNTRNKNSEHKSLLNIILTINSVILNYFLFIGVY